MVFLYALYCMRRQQSVLLRLKNERHCITKCICYNLNFHCIRAQNCDGADHPLITVYLMLLLRSVNSLERATLPVSLICCIVYCEDKEIVF